MRQAPLYRLHTTAELEKFLQNADRIKLYGAGYYLNQFLSGLKFLGKDYKEKIDVIMVSDINANPGKVSGIPVIFYREAVVGADDVVILTLGHRYTDEIYDLLKGTGAKIACVDFNMFQKKAYQDVEESIRPFIDRFPDNLSRLNEPVVESGLKAWTCWWQGEDQAPLLIRRCMESQRRNLPFGIEFIVVTEVNYKDYIDLPEYVITKVRKGDISLATLSDIIRAALLYKYGGFWLDATLFFVEPLPEDILNYPIYTRTLPETQYCTNVVWADWFLYAKPESKLFQFLMEAFFYYYSVYDRIKYYFTVDYIIAIACNTFKDIEEQIKAIPYNNEKALELGKHLREKFEKHKYEDYIKDTFIQKLSYKIQWEDEREKDCSIYEYLLDK